MSTGAIVVQSGPVGHRHRHGLCTGSVAQPVERIHDRNRHGDHHAHPDADAYSDADSDSDRDAYADTNDDSNANSDRDAYADINANPDTNSDPRACIVIDITRDDHNSPSKRSSSARRATSRRPWCSSSSSAVPSRRAAENLTAYTVFSGKTKKVHKVSEAIYNKLVPLTEAIYNASANTVILLPRGNHALPKLEQLQVNVSVLTDPRADRSTSPRTSPPR